MAYHIDKETDDIVFDGFQKGIAPSPHLGIANMQCANIYTEAGEVMCSYDRTKVSQTPISSGSFSYGNSDTLAYLGNIPLLVGTFVHVTNGGGLGLSTGYYWVNSVSGTSIQLGNYYLDSTNRLSGLTSGVAATFDTVDMGAPIQNQSAIENYTDSSGDRQTRYYIADVNGRVWVYDTGQVGGFFSGIGWAMASNSSDAGSSYATASGFVYINGCILLFSQNSIYYKMTTRLDATWTNPTSGLNSLANHFAIVNHNNYCFYCDGDNVGQILPSSVSSAGNINIFSYGTFTSDDASPSNLSFKLLGGATPVANQTLFFWTSNGGSLTNLTSATSGTTLAANPTIYFVGTVNLASRSFTVSTTVNNANPVNSISISGTGYFASPTLPSTNANNASSISKQALQLDTSDTAQCLVELGSNLLIGTASNLVYNWNEIAIAANGSLIVVQLPENNVSSFVQANNVAYAFAGNKGNIYATNGSFVSIAMTVPDYTAGIAGTPTSYIEPYFTWGGTAFMRGRIWFSIQDQTATKTGNDGGIWSFVPSFFDPLTGADQGMALRMENQNSYGTYNGMANIILPFVSQLGLGPQFYTAWSSDQSSGSATYGIDTGTTNPYAGGQTIIETDLVPTGMILGTQKKTFSGIEFKVSAPLAAGESVKIKVRQNSTSSFKEIGNGVVVGSSGGEVQGYYSPITFQKGLWLQLQIILTSTATNPTFVRLTEVRVHQT